MTRHTVWQCIMVLSGAVLVSSVLRANGPNGHAYVAHAAKDKDALNSTLKSKLQSRDDSHHWYHAYIMGAAAPDSGYLPKDGENQILDFFHGKAIGDYGQKMHNSSFLIKSLKDIRKSCGADPDKSSDPDNCWVKLLFVLGVASHQITDLGSHKIFYPTVLEGEDKLPSSEADYFGDHQLDIYIGAKGDAPPIGKDVGNELVPWLLHILDDDETYKNNQEAPSKSIAELNLFINTGIQFLEKKAGGADAVVEEIERKAPNGTALVFDENTPGSLAQSAEISAAFYNELWAAYQQGDDAIDEIDTKTFWKTQIGDELPIREKSGPYYGDRPIGWGEYFSGIFGYARETLGSLRVF